MVTVDLNQDHGVHKVTAGVATRVVTNGVAINKVAKARGTADPPGINNNKVVSGGAVSKAAVTTKVVQQEAAAVATTVSFVLSFV